ncbi:MAG: hypothetical protein RL648_932 [Verrucomicrobiota bacterium]
MAIWGGIPSPSPIKDKATGEGGLAGNCILGDACPVSVAVLTLNLSVLWPIACQNRWYQRNQLRPRIKHKAPWQEEITFDFA